MRWGRPFLRNSRSRGRMPIFWFSGGAGALYSDPPPLSPLLSPPAWWPSPTTVQATETLFAVSLVSSLGICCCCCCCYFSERPSAGVAVLVSFLTREEVLPSSSSLFPPSRLLYYFSSASSSSFLFPRANLRPRACTVRRGIASRAASQRTHARTGLRPSGRQLGKKRDPSCHCT